MQWPIGHSFPLHIIIYPTHLLFYTYFIADESRFPDRTGGRDAVVRPSKVARYAEQAFRGRVEEEHPQSQGCGIQVQCNLRVFVYR